MIKYVYRTPINTMKVARGVKRCYNRCLAMKLVNLTGTGLYVIFVNLV